jgi:hypothetical protein
MLDDLKFSKKKLQKRDCLIIDKSAKISYTKPRKEAAHMKKLLPIGISSFRKIRESGKYYVDKTLIIHDFIHFDDKVTLITRPRRFGKTLNMTTLREFFDITADSRAIFDGLAIMNTEYANQINSRPVIYLSLKDCHDTTFDSFIFSMNNIVFYEYDKYYPLLKGNVNESESHFFNFFMLHEKLLRREADINFLEMSITLLMRVLYNFYKIKPILLIDEYDTPIISGLEYGYHDRAKPFFSAFFGSALKDFDLLHQAMLTGIQRVIKESIFSQLNNVRVYTVVDERYCGYFGLNESETGELLAHYGLELNEPVKQKYNGYIFCKTEIYNPWSVLNYADTGNLESYWINTSTNYLVRKSIAEAGGYFRKHFDKLIACDTVKVAADLGCSFMELKNHATLWGLLINAGYITVLEKIDDAAMNVRIPNGEVRAEFTAIVADMANLSSMELMEMFRYLIEKDMDGFMEIYRELVLACTSYHDVKENAYHMLFLGMCITLRDIYKITSNIESGHGRSDIRMESLSPAERPHIIIEFKQGEDTDVLKEAALKQIMEKEYRAGLKGEILCIGIAHNIKKCELVCKTLTG